MKSIQERRISKLLEIIKMAGSQAKLADISGISSSEISQMKNPKHARVIGDKAARRFEECLALPNNWMDYHDFEVVLSDEENLMADQLALKTGQTRKEVLRNLLLSGIKDLRSRVSPDARYGHIESWDSNTPLEDDEVEVPFFMDVELAAGAGGEPSQERHGPKLRFSKSTLKRCNVEPENAACVKVNGNSMEPRLYDGDVVGVDLGDKKIVDGKIYAINHDGLLRIKRLYLTGGGGIRVNSFNNIEHPDEKIPPENRQIFNVIGRIFWSSSIWN